jgi:uncharacterized membrane protein YcaP (DUF421 family)
MVVFVMRLMGKRQIGELQPFEFVVTLMIADLAAVPMEDSGIPLLKGIIPIIILLAAQIFISYFSMRSQTFRQIVCGSPSILISKGKIMENELHEIRYSINDLVEQLRLKGYPNINEIEYAILETNGELSVIPKARVEEVKLKDINIFPSEPRMPITLIIDGKLQRDNLAKVNITKESLQQKLIKFNIKKPEETLVAILDTEGNFYAQPKNTA